MNCRLLYYMVKGIGKAASFNLNTITCFCTRNQSLRKLRVTGMFKKLFGLGCSPPFRKSNTEEAETEKALTIDILMYSRGHLCIKIVIHIYESC